MKKQRVFSTKLPYKLTQTLDMVCDSMGLRKNYVVEMALREKLEDLMDAYELEGAIRTETEFHSWQDVKRELKRKGKL